MSYITRTTRWRKTEIIDCNHPDVIKIWFTGSLSAIGIPTTIDLSLNIYFKNGDRKEFISVNAIEPDASDKLIIEAEEYLQSLNNK